MVDSEIKNVHSGKYQTCPFSHAHTQRVFIYYIVSNVQRIVQVTVKYDLIYTKLRDGVSTQPNTIRDDIQANTKYTFWVSQL